jgi:hypothetical protein
LSFANILIEFSDFFLQIAQNVTALAPPPLSADNTIATVGNVEAVADQTTQTIIGSLSAVGAAIGGIFVKNKHDTDKNRKEIKATDISLSEYLELEALEDKYTLQNPTKTRAEILAMPAYPDEPAIKTSLAEARAKERKEWADDIKRLYFSSNNNSS